MTAETFRTSGRFLVAPDDAAGYRYFVDELLVPHGFSSRLRRLFRKPALDIPSTAELQHLQFLDEVVSTAGARCPIVLRDYDGNPRDRITAFLFSGSAPHPSAVVKSQKIQKGETLTLRIEAEALEAVRRLLPSARRGSVPEVLRYDTAGEREILVTSVLPGRSAYAETKGAVFPSRYVERHFAAACGWLIAFHRAAAGDRPIVPGEVNDMPAHGDYWARNLLIDTRGEAAIVDWEDFTPAASPLIDLFHFPLTYGLAYPWTRYRQLPPEEAFERTFLRKTVVSSQTRSYLDRWCTAMALPLRALGHFFQQYLQTEGTMGLKNMRRAGVASLPWERLAARFARTGESVFSG